MPTKIVWVLNLSPDSFADWYIYSAHSLEQKIHKLIQDGADVIDVWAERTTPGSTPVTLEEELHRLEDFFVLLEKFKNTPVQFSLDTKKYLVARKGIEKWVHMINDVSAWRADKDMHWLIAEHPETQYVVMYCKNPYGHADLETEKNPEDILATVIEFFDNFLPMLSTQWIRKEQIILDPGMGSFISTDYRDSIKILQSIWILKTRYNLPLTISTSKKRFLSKISPDKWPYDRVGSSIVSSLFASTQGADYIRMHNVYEMRQALQTWKALQ